MIHELVEKYDDDEVVAIYLRGRSFLIENKELTNEHWTPIKQDVAIMLDAMYRLHAANEVYKKTKNVKGANRKLDKSSAKAPKVVKDRSAAANTGKGMKIVVEDENKQTVKTIGKKATKSGKKKGGI